MPRDWGEIGSNDHGDGVSLGDDENILKPDSGDSWRTLKMYKNH